MATPIESKIIDSDLDGEDNIENYGKRVGFANFVVPDDDTDISVIEVSWADASDFATGEMTEDDMIALGLDTDS